MSERGQPEERGAAMSSPPERDFSTTGGRERWFVDDLVRSWKYNFARLEAELVTARYELREAEAKRERIYHDYPPEAGPRLPMLYAAASPPDLVERLRVIAVNPRTATHRLDYWFTPEQVARGLEAMKGVLPRRMYTDALETFVAAAGATPKEENDGNA